MIEMTFFIKSQNFSIKSFRILNQYRYNFFGTKISLRVENSYAKYRELSSFDVSKQNTDTANVLNENSDKIDFLNKNSDTMVDESQKIEFIVQKPRFTLKTLNMPPLLHQNMLSICKGEK